MSKLPLSYPGIRIAERDAAAQAVEQAFVKIAVVLNNPDEGATAARPTTDLTVGQFYFDTTLGVPVWWSGTAWVDATGAPV